MRRTFIAVVLLSLLLFASLDPASAAKRKKKKKKGRRKKKPAAPSDVTSSNEKPPPRQKSKRKSQFRREVDLEALEKEWADEESDDWHEDTWEWKDKERQKKAKPMPMPGSADFDAQSFMESQQQQQNGGMQMSFVTVEGVENDARKSETEALSARWTALLKSGGVDVKPYVIDPLQILFTQDDGRFSEYKEFILDQPETAKLTWNSKDYFPSGKGSQKEL